LLNDGAGNPKNTKSLLLSDKTPPMMWLGVRDSAKTAIRAGIEHILFSHQPDEVANSIEEYLKSLKPVPSPYLVHGRLSQGAKRGQKIFTRAGCVDCHTPGLFTDLNSHDVGTSTISDRPAPKLNDQAYLRPAPPNHRKFVQTGCTTCHELGPASSSTSVYGVPRGSSIKFVTPTLVEVWRTAPYLHNGSAATVRDVVTTCNPHDQHGQTSDLSIQEIDDLCEYVLSL
jgi:cytochrome c peroxidase